MEYQKTLETLKKEGFDAVYFPTAQEAAAHIVSEFSGKTIGIGGSVTVEQLDIFDRLSQNNQVFWHWKQPVAQTHANAACSQVYLTSANAIAETGEIINIDGSGNRVASMLYGHETVVIVAGVNKLAPDFHQAMQRAKNIAAPLNARRLNRKTPCVLSEPMQCHNCSSPDRICCGVAVLERKMLAIPRMEVVLVGESLGY